MASSLELSQILNPGVPVEALPLIMAMGFYADESETTGKVFTLAGFMAAPSGWDLFVPKWREMLSNTGPYPVDAFHSADIEAARPPFDGWPIEDRRRLVETALDLLTDPKLCSNLYAVGCSLVIEDFQAVHPRFRNVSISELYEYAYRVLFFSILTRWVFNGIDFIFDEKDKVRGRVENHFRKSKALLDADPKLAGKINDVAFRDDRKVIPLQAADLLAYEMRRHTWMRLSGQNVTRSAYARIKDAFSADPDSGPPYRQRVFRCYDKRFFAGLFAEIEKNRPESETGFIDLWYHFEAPED